MFRSAPGVTWRGGSSGVMILGLGGHFLFRELGRGGWIPILAVVAILLLIRFWSPLMKRAERWWRSR